MRYCEPLGWVSRPQNISAVSSTVSPKDSRRQMLTDRTVPETRSKPSSGLGNLFCRLISSRHQLDCSTVNPPTEARHFVKVALILGLELFVRNSKTLEAAEGSFRSLMSTGLDRKSTR